MYFTKTAVLATIGLTSFAAAAPAAPAALEERQNSCSLYPWFIAPYYNSQDCTGAVAQYQPTSGPYNPNAVSTNCRPLYNPSGPPQSFLSVSINRDACPQQKYQIQLFTDANCATKATIVNTDSCVASPGTNAAGRFTHFKAIRV